MSRAFSKFSLTGDPALGIFETLAYPNPPGPLEVFSQWAPAILIIPVLPRFSREALQ